MKAWFKRLLSMALVLCLFIGCVPAMSTEAHAAAEVTVSEMLARAEAMVNYKWVPKQDIKVWHDNKYNGDDYFRKGQTVVGMPFTLFTGELGGKIGLVTFEEYKELHERTEKGNYTAYTNNCVSAKNQYRIGPRYGSCCASFVREVFGGSFMERGAWEFINVDDFLVNVKPKNSDLVTNFYNVKAADLRPGDAIINAGKTHIAWVGKVEGSKITVYEQTFPVARKVEIDLNRSDATDGNGCLQFLNCDGEMKSFPTVAKSKELVSGSYGFADVAYGDYYFDAVIWAEKNGIASGTGNGRFSPNQSCTRAQAVTFLWRAMDCPNPARTSNPFTDVKPDAYYYKAVLWAYHSGVTSGTSSTKFSPDNPCTRGQVMTFLWRAAGQPKPGTTYCPFKDVKASQYYYAPVLWAAKNNVAVGITSSQFGPDAVCTRGQIVTFLYRAQNFIKKAK